MARHDALSDACEAKIEEMLLAGISINRTAHAVGVCDKTVAVRRARLKNAEKEFTRCQCGKPSHHTGICTHRAHVRDHLPVEFGRLPRKLVSPEMATHLRRAKQKEIPQKGYSVEQLCKFVDQIVPRTLPQHIIQDTRQEILCAILSGDLEIENVVDNLPKFVSDVYKTTSINDVSLDNLYARYHPAYDEPGENEDYIDSVNAVRTGRTPGFIGAWHQLDGIEAANANVEFNSQPCGWAEASGNHPPLGLGASAHSGQKK